MDLLVGCQVGILKDVKQDLRHFRFHVPKFVADHLEEAIKSLKHGSQACKNGLQLNIGKVNSQFFVGLVAFFDETKCLG